MTYLRLEGCDDATGFEMDLTPEERELVERISIESFRRSSHSCMPWLIVLDEVPDEKSRRHHDEIISEIRREDDPKARRDIS